MDNSDLDARRPTILIGTLKIAVAVAVASSCLSVWLSWSPAGALQPAVRMAAALRGGDEPLTTGSITRMASSARLDPCVVNLRP